jgi:ATP-dependent Clp protease protease subunit
VNKIEENDIIELLHEKGIYLPNRSVVIFGDIDEDMFKRVWSNLHHLDSSSKPINIFINTGGGCVTQGFAIYDAIKGCKNLVRAMVYGECSSMGSIILQAADERLMSPNSSIMIHKGTEEYHEDHALNVERWIEHNKKLEERCNNIYLEKIKEKKNKFGIKSLEKLLPFDTILSPKEAIELGLADRIEEHF